MANVLYIGDPVVTEATLHRHHDVQAEICISPAAVVTPTGWDYIRNRRLRLTRGQVPAGSSSPVPVARTESVGESVAANTALIQAGRCERPGECFGCDGGEEFGSGFVEPASCSACPVRKLIDQGLPNSGCGGCNRHTANERAAKGAAANGAGGVEGLVQHITDQIVQRLGA